MEPAKIDRTTCRHGARLDSPCSECDKQPDVSRDWRPSDELAGIPLGAAVEERHRAEAWMDTAASHARGEDYFRGERNRLLRFIQFAIGRIGAVSAEMQQIWEENCMLLDDDATREKKAQAVQPREPPSENTDSGTLDIVIPVETPAK